MLYLTIQELEAAINYWRSQSPAEGEELRLCPEASALGPGDDEVATLGLPLRPGAGPPWVEAECSRQRLRRSRRV